MIVCVASKGEKLTQASSALRTLRELFYRADSPGWANVGRRYEALTGNKIDAKTVRHIIEGDTREPYREVVEDLSRVMRDILEESSAEVIQLSDYQSKKLAKGFALTIAVRAWKGVLGAHDDDECYLVEDGMAEIPTAFIVGGMDNADLHEVARLAGNSMSPRIESGERVIVFMDPTPIPNALMMIQCPDGRAMIKAVRNNGGRGWSFESINPDGMSQVEPDGYTFRGVVVAIMKHHDGPGPNIEWNGRALRA